MNSKTNVLKRLKIQSWRRGMKEMDLILGGFIDQYSNSLSDNEILEYEQLICQDDQLIYSWFCKQETVPADFLDIVTKISNFIEYKS